MQRFKRKLGQSERLRIKRASVVRLLQGSRKSVEVHFRATSNFKFRKQLCVFVVGSLAAAVKVIQKPDLLLFCNPGSLEHGLNKSASIDTYFDALTRQSQKPQQLLANINDLECGIRQRVSRSEE